MDARVTWSRTRHGGALRGRSSGAAAAGDVRLREAYELPVRQTPGERGTRLQAFKSHDDHAPDHLVGDQQRPAGTGVGNSLQSRCCAHGNVLIALAVREAPLVEVRSALLEQPREADGDLLVGKATEIPVMDLREILDDCHLEAKCVADRSGGRQSAAKGAAEDAVDVLLSDKRRQVLCVAVPRCRQRRVVLTLTAAQHVPLGLTVPGEDHLLERRPS